MSLTKYRKQLTGKHPTREAEDWLVTTVCTDDDRSAPVILARNFLLGDFSEPFLEYLGQHLFDTPAIGMTGPYFEFISPRGGAESTPYYKVHCFSRYNGSKLRTYLATITARHFTALKARENERNAKTTSIDAETTFDTLTSQPDVIENPWFALLIADEDMGADDENRAVAERLKQAMEMLPERERIVLELRVMGDASGLEAFEELAPYLNSKKDQSEMSRLEKQRAVAVLKDRAITHLSKLMKQ